VLKDVTWWTGILLALEGLGVAVVLPPEGRQWIGQMTGNWPSESLLGPPVVVVVLAFLLAHQAKVHERYERAVLRWRDAYDVDFIIPCLVEPFGSQMDPRFPRVARENRVRVMNRLFYDFVRDRTPKIDEHLVARFYERILTFWILVENELALVVFGGVCSVCLLAVLLAKGDPTVQIAAVVVVVVGGLLNRRLVRGADASARKRTVEEVEAIMDLHRDDLEKALRDLHERYGLVFGHHA
jgi:hypothetical protein